MLIGLMNNKTNIMWKGFNMEKNIDIYNKKEECNIKAKIFYNEEDSIKTNIFILNTNDNHYR